jgi:deoxyadenosine/deoxycytidine kinase
MKAKYICVEGPIGAGKSELVAALSEKINAQQVVDQPNPFLPAFYQNMDQYAFQVQLYFLLSRFGQQKELAQGSLFSSNLVCDYLFQKDRLFASLTLEPAEFALYEKVYSLLGGTITKPDVVVYLQQTTDQLIKRMAKKNEELTLLIPKAYIENVVQAYQTFFQHYHQSPIIVISSENKRFMENEKNIDLLIRKIMEVESGTHYLHIQED